MERGRKRRMGKKKKVAVLMTGITLVSLLAIFIIISVKGRRREINQKVLFIYRISAMYQGRQFINKGYFIDNQGRKIEYDFTRTLEIGERYGMYKEELLELLEEMEYEESKVIFSEGEVQRLYGWLYKIDAEQKIEREYYTYEPITYELLGIRYKEDGTAEIIQIFEIGCYKAENQDSNALEIRQALLRENPIRTLHGEYYDK